MSLEQSFLIKYGIHNFVRCVETNGKVTFLVHKDERENMIRHATQLLQGGYGAGVDIRLV